MIIVVPRIDKSGPVKGALALQKGLTHAGLSTEIIYFYETDPSIRKDLRCRQIHGNFLQIVRQLKSLKTSISSNTLIISYCFQSDFFLFAANLHKQAGSFIRGNLWKNYRYSFGIPGYALALLHYLISSKFSKILVLNEDMKTTVRLFGKQAIVLPNFIDERVDIYRRPNRNKNKIVFVGSLTERKDPILLVRTVNFLRNSGFSVELDVLGDGPLKGQISDLISEFGLSDVVRLHGNVDDPYTFLVDASLFVLPSHSEGTSRAALEALFAGVPVIMRDVDDNQKIKNVSEWVEVFSDDNELPSLIKSVLSKEIPSTKNLLPDKHRQDRCIQSFLTLLSQ